MAVLKTQIPNSPLLAIELCKRFFTKLEHISIHLWINCSIEAVWPFRPWYVLVILSRPAHGCLRSVASHGSRAPTHVHIRTRHAAKTWLFGSVLWSPGVLKIFDYSRREQRVRGNREGARLRSDFVPFDRALGFVVKISIFDDLLLHNIHILFSTSVLDFISSYGVLRTLIPRSNQTRPYPRWT